MKKMLAALMCAALLCCMAVCAMATGIEKVDAERLLVGLDDIPGLVEGENVTVKRKDGKLDILIHSNKVDWKQVLTYAYDAGSGYVTIYPGFKSPGTVNGKTVVYEMGYGTNSDSSDSSVLEFLEKDEEMLNGEYNTGDRFFNGMEIGQYSASERLFVPQEGEHDLVCRWYDADGNALLTERMTISVKQTNTRTMNVGIDGVDRARISAHPDSSIKDELEISIGDGAVRVQTADAEKLEQSDVEFRIAPPAIDGVSNWGCRYRRYAFEDMEEYERFERHGYLSLTPRMPGTEPYTIEWYDKTTGEALRVERITFTMVSLAEKPWPSYRYEGYPELKPVPGENLTVNDTTRAELGKQLGIRVTYGEKGEGILHFAPTENLLEKSAALSECFFRYSVKAPEGAAYYSENHSSSSDIFGEDIWFMADQDIYLRDMEERRAVPENGVVECRSGYMPFREHKGEGDTRVFLPCEMTGEFAGGVTIIYWYDKDGDFLSAQYFVERQDPFVVTYQERELHQLPSGRLELPRLHIKGLRSDHPYVLYIDCYPQEGENSFYYELYLVDGKTDARISLDEFREREKITDEWLDLYLPYPEGFDQDSDASYTVRHYDESGSCDKYTSDGDGRFVLEKAEQGLKLKVASLSPFEVSFEGGEGGGDDNMLVVQMGEHEMAFQFDGNNPALLVQFCMKDECEDCRKMNVSHHLAFAEVLFAPSMAPGETVKLDVTENWVGEAPKLLFRPADSEPDPDSYSVKMPEELGAYIIALEIDLGDGETAILDNGLPFEIADVSAADLPQTGDPSSLMGWAMLLGASAAGLKIRRRKK